MAEVQDRHRKAAKAVYDDALGLEQAQDAYAQALADVEDLNGYDLTACRAAYALVCEAVNPGMGPGGAAAVAISVQLLRRRAERAEGMIALLAEANPNKHKLPEGYTWDEERKTVFGPDGDGVVWLKGENWFFNTLNDGLPPQVVLAVLHQEFG